MAEPSLSPRLLRLLQAVVEEYQKTALPVGSQTLVDAYGLGVSSATVRNWFAELDEAGYLVQPHTSGGRVPTELGYRYYVETSLHQLALDPEERAALESAAAQPEAVRHKHLARSVADLTGLAVFARLGMIDSYYTGLSQLFGQPEFRDWNRVVSLSEVLDRLDDALHQLPPASDPRVLVGAESPFGPACSVIYLGREGMMFGVLGPLRLPYQRVYAAVQAVHQLLK